MLFLRFLVGEVELDSIQTTCLHADHPSGAGKISRIAAGMEDGLSSDRKVPRVTASQWRFAEGGVGSLMHAVCLQGDGCFETQIDILMDGLRMTLYEPYEPTCKLMVHDGRGGPGREFSESYGSDDPYKSELETFVSSVRSGDASAIRSSYADAAKTYELSWQVRRAGERK